MGKMSPEKARELRDEGRHRISPFTPQPGPRKHRELRFHPRFPGDAEAARELLAGLPNLEVDAGLMPNCLSIWYDITDYTFEGIVKALARQGFHLDNSPRARIARALAFFCEETQLRNLHGPQRLIKKSNDIYSKAWEHHPHGDHDDTPPDLRQDK